MTLLATRRDFLRLSLLGGAAAAVPPAVELATEIVLPRYVRKVWQVPSSAPVGSRIERVGGIASYSLDGVNVRQHPYVEAGTAWDVRLPGHPREVLMSPRDYEALVRALKVQAELNPRDATGTVMVDRVELVNGRWDLKAMGDELARYGVGKVRAESPANAIALEAKILGEQFANPPRTVVFGQGRWGMGA